MPEIVETPTLIVGAGPAGLAVAGRMRRMGFPFEMIDAAGEIAASWRAHYDRLHLHTVKQLSHLPYRPFPKDYPTYVSRDALIDYFEDYAKTFVIEPRLTTRAASIRRSDGGWLVTTDTGPDFLSNRVVVATGANRVPNRPVIDGEEDFGGPILHSRSYRNPDRFRGDRVLVVGMGNTGAEIALDLCEHGVECAISVRGPVNIVPRDVLGRPVQLTARTLGHLPDAVADRIGTALRRLTMGGLEAYGIPTPQLAPVAQLRVYGKTPVIDVGTVARIKKGEILVRPRIRRLEPGTVVFDDGSAEAFGSIVLATGYKPLVEEIVEDGRKLLDANGFPARVSAHGSHHGLFFTGFNNYLTGGVLGTLMTESDEIVGSIGSGGGFA